MNTVRQGIEVKAPSLDGINPTTGYANDPVNTATGNFIEPETDLVCDGIASSLSFTRMYNSMSDHSGVFGPGWSSPLEMHLVFEVDQTAFVMADGRQLVFPGEGPVERRAENANFWITEDPSASLVGLSSSEARVHVVRNNQGAWWAFSPVGEWLGLGSGPGTSINAVRNERNQIVELRHEFGRKIRVEYTDGRVVSAHSSDGRSVEYEYDDQFRLRSVTSEAGTRRYQWNRAGLVVQVTATTGVIECENTYDDARRVTKQITEFGREVRFAYLPGRVTAVSDADGDNSNTWIADRQGRLVAVVDTDERRQSMSYDAHGNLVSVTERDGCITNHFYDQRGRRVRTVRPEGADIRNTFDDFDRVIEIRTGELAATRFDYAETADRFPSLVIDPLGGITRLSWKLGLLTEVKDPAGVTTFFNYDEHGEIAAVIDAMGNATRFTRDVAGRLTETLAPAGHRT